MTEPSASDRDPERGVPEAWLRAAFDEPGAASSSVHAFIQDRTGESPRVLLLDRADEEAAPPVAVDSDEAPRGTTLHERYQVIGEIARGGMGVVLMGRDTELGRDVALKILRRGSRTDSTLLKRFVEEAQVGGQLQHPGIVPVYDLGLMADDRPFFAMKLVRGQTLARMLEERDDLTQGLHRLLLVFEHVCQTVAYAHARGVIHRDLKPSNIMVGRFGEVQVMDWGLAKVLRTGGSADDELSRSQETTTDPVATVRSGSADAASDAGSVMGTIAYMAPEQARGEIENLDERCDVFALGALLCELLTGKPPFWGSAADALVQARQGQLAPAHERLRDCAVDAELVDLACSCTAADRDARPRRADEVARRVRGYLEARDEQARAMEIAAAEAKARAVEERRRRQVTRTLWMTVSATLLLATAGYLGWQHDRNTRIAETRAAIGEALDEAVAHRARASATTPVDESRLVDARAAAHRAEALAAVGPIDAFTSERSSQLLGEINRELDAARTAARSRQRDRGMQHKLQEIRIPHAEEGYFSWQARAYAAAFADFGIDVPKLEIEAAAKLVRESAIRSELTAALDHWALVLRVSQGAVGEATIERLLDVARAADEAGDLRSLRDAWHLKEADRLEQLAEALDPASVSLQALHFAGRALFELGRPQASRRLLEAAHAIHPSDFWINHDLGVLYEDSDPPDLPQALAYYRAAQACQPEEAEILIHISDVLKTLGHREQATATLERAVTIGGNDPAIRLAMARQLIQGRQLVAAEAHLRTAAELAPDHPNVLVALGQYLHDQKRYDEALPVLERACELDATQGVAWWLLGDIFEQRKEMARATEAYEKAVALAPRRDNPARGRASTLVTNLAAVQASLGRALVQTGDIDRALPHLEKAIDLDPDNHDARDALGLALHRKGRFAEAEREFRAALTSDPACVFSLTGLAAALTDQGRHADAIDPLARAIRRAPGTPGLRVSAARAAVAAAAKADSERAPALRERALVWLRGELDRMRPSDDASPAEREARLQGLRDWKRDSILATTRSSTELIPAEEQVAWNSLWNEIEREIKALANGRR